MIIDEQKIISISILVLIVLIETLFPFRKYLGRIRHYGKNAVFSIINGIITGFTSAALYVYIFLFTQEHGFGLLNQIPMPSAVSTVAACLIFDCWIYTWHRANHKISFLWRFHQVHHNDINMDASTAFRFHPGEIMISSFLDALIFLVTGIQMEQLIIYKLIFRTNILIHHSNIAIPEGVDKILRLVIVTPNTHRVHHSTIKDETDSNFSSVLTLWDRMFGTFKERDPEKITYGLETDRTPECQTIPYLLKLPFKNMRISRKYHQLSSEKAAVLIKQKGTVVLDVRKHKDYETSHIDGARSMDMDKLNTFIAQADKSQPVICYCYKGISSRKYCQTLTQSGFTHVYNINGGYTAWQSAEKKISETQS
jgi:sterol desaturase/sphingolipid hydroxylase (fatty acid hydroxylase superfamily)/rhodanese-related sulfurtransferase